jgi:2'-5' RNA ligase
MRLFAAVLPPGPALDALAAAVDRVRAGLPDAGRLRWTDPAGWHVLLAFYGDVPEAAGPALRDRLARAAARHPPHRLCLAGGGRFGDRVLWAGVDGERAALTRLAGAAAAAGRRAGAAGPAADDRRPYRPHLTLARSRDRGRARVRLAPFADALAGFRGEPWTAAELRLLRSRLPAPGRPGEPPRYETLAAWPLGG